MAKIWFLTLGDGNTLNITLASDIFRTTGNLQTNIYSYPKYCTVIYLYKNVWTYLGWYTYSHHQEELTRVVLR